MSQLVAKGALLSATAAFAASLAGGATASPNPPSDFGRHVATCAHEHLGQRLEPPSVTCMHDGMEMTFPNFGAMVEHMRLHHG